MLRFPTRRSFLRAAAVGGTVTAGDDGNGTFQLRARLPVPLTRMS